MFKRSLPSLRGAFVAVFAAVVLAGGIAACSGANNSTTTPFSSPTPFSPVLSGSLFVVNSGSNSIAIFTPSPSPSTAPFAVLAGSNTKLSHPQYVFFDANRNAYVTNNDPVNGPSVTIYPTGTTGNSAPSSVIAGSNTLMSVISGIVVDGYGRIYVANYIPGTNPTSQILVYAQGASGNVAPATQIAGSLTQLSQPNGMFFDTSGNLYVANATGAVTVYAAFTFGNTAPIRAISGAATELTQPNGLIVDGNGNCYVSDFLANRILVFAAGQTGNITPSRTIFGSSTGLSSPSGMALDGIGDLYVSNSNGVTVYPPLSVGNATPAATLTNGITAPVGVSISF